MVNHRGAVGSVGIAWPGHVLCTAVHLVRVRGFAIAARVVEDKPLGISVLYIFQ